MKLCIVSRLGTVHRVYADGRTCREAAGRRQVEVNLNQCLVYRLVSCTNCWPHRETYVHAVATGRFE